MKKKSKYILALFLVVTTLVGTAFVSIQTADAEEEVTTAVNWMTFEEAVAKSKVEKKKIFIDVYTDWCGWCKHMDKNTFSQKEIAAYLNKNFYAVKLDAEQKEDIIFKSNTYKFVPSGKRGYHQLAAALLQNKLSFPTVVFLDEDFNMTITPPIPGYKKAKEFDTIIKYIGGEHFKKTPWEEFQKTYISPVGS